ncbi:hypothetical protein FOMG_19798 [Fusarium oxysporum f. sp. melonis 26406]|uniref:Uncharacterized protein n=1 Tax=Fusarium oxysporum f. sp. melonis 26406 TaxID=1089452 RepID=W9Z580_FUSOX|nr:hypothetical protein FOMG_19798 [Fusarium oxysporum f. sp. melonis 26406]
MAQMVSKRMGAFGTKSSSFFPQSPSPPYYSSHPTKH